MTPTIGPAARGLIQSFEKCRLHAYRDGGGILTVGWGHTGLDVGAGTVWTQAEADAAFARDLAQRCAPLADALGMSPTTPAQFGALVSLSYNAGVGGILRSTLLARHKAGDFTGAAAQFLRWDHDHAGNEVAGLLRRRRAEAALYRGDFAEMEREMAA